MAQIDMSSGSASAYGAGELQLQNKAPMDGTLRFVTDSANTASPLKLSTALVQSTSTLKITTSDVAYIDAEDNSGNNRFTVSRASASQLVTVDFASLPTALTTPVGAIRTATDGVNLANVMTFLENGNIGINTDTAGSKLDVHSGANVIAQFNRTGAGKSWIQYLLAGAAKWNTGNDNVNGNYTIYDAVNSLDRMVVTNAGNVGIGTTAPNIGGYVAGNTVLTMAPSDADKFSVLQLSGNRGFGGNQNGNIDFINSEGTATITSRISAINGANALDGQIAFETRTSAGSLTERLRITSAGNVGIGTDAPTARLHVYQSVAGASPTNILRLSNDGVGYTTRISMSDQATVDAFIDCKGDASAVANQYLAFGLNASVDTLKITGDNYVRLNSGSGGIQFNGDTAAANALDDYEEGTWTMGIAFGGASTGIAYAVNTGTYTKIGRQVTVTGLMNLSNKGTATGSAQVTGLPFSIPNAIENYSTANLWLNAVTFVGQFQAFGNINSTRVNLFQLSNLGTVSDLTDVNFANNSQVMINLTYFV